VVVAVVEVVLYLVLIEDSMELMHMLVELL